MVAKRLSLSVLLAVGICSLGMRSAQADAPWQLQYWGGHVVSNGTIVEIDWNGGNGDWSPLYSWLPGSTYTRWLASVYATDIMSVSGNPGTNERPSLSAFLMRIPVTT